LKQEQSKIFVDNIFENESVQNQHASTPRASFVVYVTRRHPTA